jgi:23S rRNA (cytidine2498-2'-O)-methyltransferase
LLDEHKLAFSAICTSPFPAGVIEFEEDKEGPPSRAYLKLMEALTIARCHPKAGEKCFDAGASPGGWSWVLSKLGASVIACDRAALDPKIAAHPNISFIKHDAFTLKPQDIGEIDWLFCDAACYPARLYDWIVKWLESDLCKRFVCTIKMQGEVPSTEFAAAGNGAAGNGANTADFVTPRKFAALKGGFVTHLYHNKHELTWIKVS